MAEQQLKWIENNSFTPEAAALLRENTSHEYFTSFLEALESTGLENPSVLTWKQALDAVYVANQQTYSQDANNPDPAYNPLMLPDYALNAITAAAHAQLAPAHDTSTQDRIDIIRGIRNYAMSQNTDTEIARVEIMDDQEQTLLRDAQRFKFYIDVAKQYALNVESEFNSPQVAKQDLVDSLSNLTRYAISFAEQLTDISDYIDSMKNTTAQEIGRRFYEAITEIPDPEATYDQDLIDFISTRVEGYFAANTAYEEQDTQQGASFDAQQQALVNRTNNTQREADLEVGATPPFPTPDNNMASAFAEISEAARNAEREADLSPAARQTDVDNAQALAAQPEDVSTEPPQYTEANAEELQNNATALGSTLPDSSYVAGQTAPSNASIDYDAPLPNIESFKAEKVFLGTHIQAAMDYAYAAIAQQNALSGPTPLHLANRPSVPQEQNNGLLIARQIADELSEALDIVRFSSNSDRILDHVERNSHRPTTPYLKSLVEGALFEQSLKDVSTMQTKQAIVSFVDDLIEGREAETIVDDTISMVPNYDATPVDPPLEWMPTVTQTPELSQILVTPQTWSIIESYTSRDYVEQLETELQAMQPGAQVNSWSQLTPAIARTSAQSFLYTDIDTAIAEAAQHDLENYLKGRGEKDHDYADIIQAFQEKTQASFSAEYEQASAAGLDNTTRENLSVSKDILSGVISEANLAEEEAKAEQEREAQEAAKQKWREDNLLAENPEEELVGDEAPKKWTDEIEAEIAAKQAIIAEQNAQRAQDLEFSANTDYSFGNKLEEEPYFSAIDPLEAAQQADAEEELEMPEADATALDAQELKFEENIEDQETVIMTSQEREAITTQALLNAADEELAMPEADENAVTDDRLDFSQSAELTDDSETQVIGTPQGRDVGPQMLNTNTKPSEPRQDTENSATKAITPQPTEVVHLSSEESVDDPATPPTIDSAQNVYNKKISENNGPLEFNTADESTEDMTTDVISTPSGRPIGNQMPVLHTEIVEDKAPEATLAQKLSSTLSRWGGAVLGAIGLGGSPTVKTNRKTAQTGISTKTTPAAGSKTPLHPTIEKAVEPPHTKGNGPFELIEKQQKATEKSFANQTATSEVLTLADFFSAAAKTKPSPNAQSMVDSIALSISQGKTAGEVYETIKTHAAKAESEETKSELETFGNSFFSNLHSAHKASASTATQLTQKREAERQKENAIV